MCDPAYRARSRSGLSNRPSPGLECPRHASVLAVPGRRTSGVAHCSRSGAGVRVREGERLAPATGRRGRVRRAAGGAVPPRLRLRALPSLRGRRGRRAHAAATGAWSAARWRRQHRSAGLDRPLRSFELALGLPVRLYYTGDDSAAPLVASRGIGDLRLVPKVEHRRTAATPSGGRSAPPCR